MSLMHIYLAAPFFNPKQLELVKKLVAYPETAEVLRKMMREQN